jgi:hypothetical protein
MAKRGSSESGGMMIAVIVVIVIANLLSNTLNFGTIYNFGFNQYISNVTSLHEDSYAKSNMDLKVYNQIIKVEDLNKTDNHVIMTQDSNFEIKGNIQKEYTQWIAVEFFKNNNVIHGYILINDTSVNSGVGNLIDKKLSKNNYFDELSNKMINDLRNKQFKIYIKEVINKYDIKEVSTSIEKQQISESEEFELLYSEKDINYYYYKSNKSEINELYEMYYGNNYKTIFLNSSKKYNPSSDGVYSKNILSKLLDSKLFNIFLIILFIMSIKYYFKYSKSDKCNKCGSMDIYTLESVIKDEKYEFENKNGTPDKRKKNNRIIQTIEIQEGCNNCNAEWYYEETRYKS